MDEAVTSPPDHLPEVGDASVALRRTLDRAVDLLGREHEPVVIAECPHKYNDAWYDDLWYAERAGTTWSERSVFFRDGRDPLVEETSRHHDGGPDGDRAASDAAGGATVARLRDRRRALAKAGWRAMVDAAFGGTDVPSGDQALVALVIWAGRPWLVLEIPNVGDAHVLSWDDGGFFEVGRMDRFDQSFAADPPLRFATVDPRGVARLDGASANEFVPGVVDERAAGRLHDLVSAAVEAVRGVTSEPVAIVGAGCPAQPWGGRAMLTTAYGAGLRRGEGEVRSARPDGTYPDYEPGWHEKGEAGPYSATAVALHRVIDGLDERHLRPKVEDVLNEPSVSEGRPPRGFREVAEAAFGARFGEGRTLALVVSTHDAVVVTGNGGVRVTGDGFEPIGPFDLPDLTRPDDLTFPDGPTADAPRA